MQEDLHFFVCNTQRKKEADTNIRFHCPQHTCTDRFFKIILTPEMSPRKQNLFYCFSQQFPTALLLQHENRV